MVRTSFYALIGHWCMSFCDFLKLIFPFSLINTIAIVELIQMGIQHTNQISCPPLVKSIQGMWTGSAL